jgi:hypothetical protein
MSSLGLGAMVCGLWLAQRGRTAGLTRLVTISLLIQGVALVLSTLTGGLIWLAAACLGAAGFAMVIGGIGSQSLIQNTVDSQMRARVMSLFVVISWGLPAFGSLFAGWLASFVGLPATFAAGGILTAMLWIWARRLAPALAPKLETEHTEKAG